MSALKWDPFAKVLQVSESTKTVEFDLHIVN